MAAIYLVLSLLAGFGVVQRLWPQASVLTRLVGAFAVGVVLTGWVAFAAAWIAHGRGSDDATFVGVWVATAVNAALVVACRDRFRRSAIQASRVDLLGVAGALALAGWIMHARLSGDPLTVSANTWGDTSLHVGIARSFSAGANFPPELPIFAGESIRYHFGFDFYAGSLERAGLPIGWAFNLPGALAFAAILVLLVEYARLLWCSTAVGVIAAGLFATNSSLAFLRYLQAEGGLRSALSPSTLWNHVGYDGGGPYNGDEISIFMTLNPYLTQTHLMVALVAVLFVGLVLLRSLRESAELGRLAMVALGTLLGAAFWLNGIVVVVMGGYCAVLFGLCGAGPAMTRVRRSLPFLLAAGLVALPQLVWLNGGVGTGGSVSFHTGYLVEDFSAVDPRSWWDFTRYWWLNLGLVFPLLVLAVVWCRKADRKLFLAVMSIFVIGNLVAFGREVGGHNHKVFNLWEILANLFAAYALVRLVTWLWSAGVLGSRSLAIGTAVVATVGLLASGVLDYLTLKNDPRYEVFGDRAPAIAWIQNQTEPDAVFLTAYGEVYTTPTLAGRRVYLGGFRPWTAIMGYDNEPRERLIAAFYAAPDHATACRQLAGTGVDYVEFGEPELRSGAFEANAALFPGEFQAAYTDGSYSYYDVERSCGTAATSGATR